MAFARVYSDEQREAIAHAWADLNIRPAERIAALAGAGELTSDGVRLAPFRVPAQTCRDIGGKHLRRRAGKLRTRLLELEPRDAVEQLRRRLLSAVDHELATIERVQGRRKPADIDRMRQLARLVRELAALPTPSVPALADKPDRGRASTRPGLAGQILRAARAPAPVHEPRAAAESDGEQQGASSEDGAGDHV